MCYSVRCGCKFLIFGSERGFWGGFAEVSFLVSIRIVFRIEVFKFVWRLELLFGVFKL